MGWYITIMRLNEVGTYEVVVSIVNADTPKEAITQSISTLGLENIVAIEVVDYKDIEPELIQVTMSSSDEIEYYNTYVR